MYVLFGKNPSVQFLSRSQTHENRYFPGETRETRLWEQDSIFLKVSTRGHVYVKFNVNLSIHFEVLCYMMLLL